MKRRWIALLCVLLAAAGIGAVVHFGPARDDDDSARGVEMQLVPIHRERSIILMADEPAPSDVDPQRIVRMWDAEPSPPDAETRRRFDGRWTGDSDMGSVTVLLLDGVGDLHTGSGDQAKVWGFELQQYFGDDLIYIRIWREDCGAMWVAECHGEADSFLVREVRGRWTDRPLEGILKLPKVPFTLRREKPDSQ